MNDDAVTNPMATRTVVYQVPGMEAVDVEQELPYAAAGDAPLTFDLYRPAGETADRPPVVVLVAGYPDPGFRRIFGRPFKAMGWSVSWARLLAASGVAAVAYTNRDPAADLDALLAHLVADAPRLRVDAGRLAFWAASGNVPLALSRLLRNGGPAVRCAALLYGFTLDLEGETAVAEAAATFGFANPAAGRGVADLRPDVPLLLARAGRDENPGLNAALDRFAGTAGAAGLPVTLAEHADGPHAFDLLDPGEASQAVVRQVVAFLTDHLLR